MNRRGVFRRELIEDLERKGYKTSEVFCIKNNGERDGIMFHNKSTFSPVLFLDDLYDEYIKGKTVSKLTDMLIGKIPELDSMEKKLQEYPVMKQLQEYSNIRKDVRLCMVSKSANKALLSETPHRDYGDFAAVVYWMPEIQNEINMRMLLRQETIDTMHVNFDKVFKDAYVNMMGEFELKSMEDMLYELIAHQFKSGEMGDIPADLYIQRMCQGIEMYLLTHKSGVFGSAAMCYQRELEKAANQIGDDYVIIPASIHELILVPFKKNIPLEAINELIRQVNAEQLEQEERLAESAYVYSAREKCIMDEREYLQKTQMERVNELHQRSENAAGKEWRDERCLM